MKKESQPRRNADDNTVTFRLPPDDILELVRRSDMLRISRHLLAQYYVTQMLTVENDHSDMVNAIRDLFTTINELRMDIAVGVEALLLASGQYTEPEARGWVKSQFKIRIPGVETAKAEDVS